MAVKKLVLFGAGKIGRSFIGQLFARSGFEVVFIDISEEIINELNKRRGYEVRIAGMSDEQTIMVDNVRGVVLSDTERVVEELSTADISAVSVGQAGLPHAAKLIAKGIEKRWQAFGLRPLDIILAENIRDGASVFFNMMTGHLLTDIPLKELAGIVETSIGKMVPIMPAEIQKRDPLLVFAEPYNTLIVDANGFLNPIPEVRGLAPEKNITAWVDRKSYIHNLGHAAAAYAGYAVMPEVKYIYEALECNQIVDFTAAAMKQSAEILLTKYPLEFTRTMLCEHIDDLLERFRNRALADTIFRVGCDLQRKLSRKDRILSPLIDGVHEGLPVEHIARVLGFALRFRASDEYNIMFPGDIEFARILQDNGIGYILENICGLDPICDKEVIAEIRQVI